VGQNGAGSAGEARRGRGTIRGRPGGGGKTSVQAGGPEMVIGGRWGTWKGGLRQSARRGTRTATGFRDPGGGAGGAPGGARRTPAASGAAESICPMPCGVEGGRGGRRLGGPPRVPLPTVINRISSTRFLILWKRRRAEYGKGGTMTRGGTWKGLRGRVKWTPFQFLGGSGNFNVQERSFDKREGSKPKGNSADLIRK